MRLWHYSTCPGWASVGSSAVEGTEIVDVKPKVKAIERLSEHALIEESRSRGHQALIPTMANLLMSKYGCLCVQDLLKGRYFEMSSSEVTQGFPFGEVSTAFGKVEKEDEMCIGVPEALNVVKGQRVNGAIARTEYLYAGHNAK